MKRKYLFHPAPGERAECSFSILLKALTGVGSAPGVSLPHNRLKQDPLAHKTEIVAMGTVGGAFGIIARNESARVGCFHMPAGRDPGFIDLFSLPIDGRFVALFRHNLP